MEKDKKYLLARLLKALSILVISLLAYYLTARGYEYSVFLGSFLLALTIYRINPVNLALRNNEVKVISSHKRVAQLVISFASGIIYYLGDISLDFVERAAYARTLFFENNLLIVDFSEVYWSVTQAVLWMLVILGIIVSVQIYFVRVSKSLNLMKRGQCVDIMTTVFFLVAFLSLGGSALINFVVLPVVTLYVLVPFVFRRLREAVFSISASGIRSLLNKARKLWTRQKIAELAEQPGKLKRSFLIKWIEQPRSPETSRLRRILLLSIVFLTLNIRFMSMDLGQVTFMSAALFPIIISYYGIKNSWTNSVKLFIAICLSYSVVLGISLLNPMNFPAVSAIVMFTTPLTIPEQAFSQIMFDARVIISLSIYGVLLLLFGVYYIESASVTISKSLNRQRIKRWKELWRLGEILILSAYSTLLLAVFYLVNLHAMMLAYMVVWFPFLLVFEVGYRWELKELEKHLSQKSSYPMND